MRNRRTGILVIIALVIVLAIVIGAAFAANRASPQPSQVPATATPMAASSPAWRPGDPDPVLTPGAIDPAVTQDNIDSTICVSGYTATVRPPSSYTTKLKIQQFAQYGYSNPKTSDYEEDHLISLELGGAPRDPANLWPEPYTLIAPDGSNVGARAKDKFENYLHRLVCSGAMPLAVAQDQIAHDWLGHWLADGSPSS